MSTVAAISITDSQAVVVTGEQDAHGKIRIFGVFPIELQLPTGDEHPEAVDAEADPAKAAERADIRPALTARPPVPMDSVDSVVAVLGCSRVLYVKTSLPFADAKRLERILPLQVQDIVPFDVDEFVIADVNLGKNGSDQFEIVASMAPAVEIKRALEVAASLRGDPKLLSTRASALTVISYLLRETLRGTYGLLSVGAAGASLAVYIDDKLKHLRDFPPYFTSAQGDVLTPAALSAMKSSVLSLEQELKIRLPLIYFIGSPEAAVQCAEEFRIPLKRLDLEDIVQNETRERLQWGDLSWAIGLIAAEHTKPRELPAPLVDFRRGAFTYQPAWGSFWSALKEEFLPIALALIFLVGWTGSIIYRSTRSLQVIDQKIRQTVSAAVPGEPVSRGAELSEMTDRVQQVEDQLRGIGSLSSLSPLETLRELSQAIGPELDLEIDSLSIGHSRLIFRGSVKDTPATGTLEELLKGRKERFCSVNITPQGQGRQSRVNFSAEISICE